MEIALIHGSYHGAWCWDRLRPELEALVHRTTAVDLPISDPSAGAEVYARTVEASLGDGEPPVIVAHSMGGLVAPLVAARRPVRRLVFLAAFLPTPGMSANDQREAEALDPPFVPTSAEWTDLGDDVWMIGPTTATELFFYDLEPTIRDAAIAGLRPQSYRVMREVTPLTAWPEVPCAVIACRDDHAISPDWVRSAAHDRLGVEAAEIEGGHSPMLGRPAELARLIDSLIGEGRVAPAETR